jgi:TM2 domain-containing membrane protein YozV
MNCAYHSQNAAAAQCNGCGKALCPACDHRIKGFPYCQDCIVEGVDLLRQQSRTSYAPFIKKQTSPAAALLLSFIPGLGAAYNGQTAKGLVHFGLSTGLLHLSLQTGIALFFFGAVAMWAYAAMDAFRSARMIRSGLTPEIAEDIFVKRFTGHPKLWGAMLIVLGVGYLVQHVFNLKGLMRGLLPAMLIALGIYTLRGFIFKEGEPAGGDVPDFDARRPAGMFPGPQGSGRFQTGEYGGRSEYPRGQAGGWRR